MKTIHKILVPVDFSAPSKRALDMALTIASRYQASIELMHAVDFPSDMLPDNVSVAGAAPMTFEHYAHEGAEREMKSLLDSMAEELSHAGVTVTSRIVRGEAAEAIVELVTKEHHDLVVMGTHGRTGLDHILLGSVAERVVRRSPSPVLTTREASSS
jgi:universal stress protein A